MRFSLLLFLSTVFFCVEVLGQPIDSLRSIAIDKSTPDTTRMKVYNELSVALRNQDFEESLQAAQDGLELAKAVGNAKWAGVSYSNIGGAYFASNRFPEAERAFLSAQEIFQGIGNMEGLSDCLGNLGTLYSSTRDIDNAILHLQAANRLRDSLGLKRKLAVGLNNLANAYADQGNFEESYNTHQAAISLRIELQDKAGLAQSYSSLISFFGQQGRLDSALHYAQQTIPLYKATENTNGLAIVHFNCGHIYTMQGQFKEAYDNYANARDYFTQSGNTGAKLKAEMSIGQVLYNMGEYDDAIERINVAIEALEEVNDIPGLATAYTNLANVVYDKYRFNEEEHLILDSVLVLHQKSLSYHRRLKSQSGIAQGLVNVGTVLWKQENYAAAIENLEEGVALYRALGNERSMDSALISLGKCYMKLNKPAEALPYFESAKSIREANGLFSGDFYADLAQAYAGVGNYQRAYEHMVLDEQVRDSVYIQEKIAAITETEAKYQTEQQKAENELLKKEGELSEALIQRQRITLWGGLFLLLLGVGLLWILYQRGEERRSTNEILRTQKTRIETLHKELSHRVKNNLAFITALMRMHSRRLDNLEAKQAIKEGQARLEVMSLLHRKLEGLQDKPSLDVGSYLEELCAQLQATFPNAGSLPKLNLQTDPLELPGEVVMRIGLIINELLTNSYKYAFGQQLNPNISIKLENIEPDQFRLSYEDNGVGMPSTFDLATAKSLGVKLINTLTKQLHGELTQGGTKGARFVFDFSKGALAG